MEKSLKDIQSLEDHRGIAIDRVGIRSLRSPIEFINQDSSVSSVATWTMTVSLSKEHKGTHMSRFVETLKANYKFDIEGLINFPQLLLEKIGGEHAYIKTEFPYFREKISPVSGQKSLLDYDISFEIEASKTQTDAILELHVPITTLCPCSKEISEYGAHNQRGFIRLAVRFDDILALNLNKFISELEELGSSQLYSLLKRVDEKFVTEQAYDNPGFVEDVIREVANYLNKNNTITWYSVEIENEESIHTHNAYAIIEKDKTIS
mgnify:CR=1 FL=1